MHNNWKRIFRRAVEEMRATVQIAKYTSWEGAVLTFVAKLIIQIMNRTGCPETGFIKKLLLKKHDVMLTYFEKSFSSFASQYSIEKVLPETDHILRNRIWVCWWQGLDNAPELVKKCVDSIAQNAGEHEVTVITEQNFEKYVNIPAWVIEKYRKGIISRTHFSDILRLSLLAAHGGMWLDATFFCTEPILSSYFHLPLWSIKRPDYLHISVACGQFATYSLACTCENRWVFATIRDLVLHYWKENDILIDYLFLDYLFVYAQHMDPQIAQMFWEIPPNNANCDDLCKVLNEVYDGDKWSEITKDTSLYKLTWKQEFLMKQDNQDTFYAKLLNSELKK